MPSYTHAACAGAIYGVFGADKGAETAWTPEYPASDKFADDIINGRDLSHVLNTLPGLRT